MIKAIGWGGNLLVLGLERANLDKLLEGKPILIAPEQLPGLRQFVLIAGGDDGEKLKRDLQHLLPPDALDAPAPKPGEEVVVTSEGVKVQPASDPDELAKRAREEEAARRAGEAKGLDLDKFKGIARDIAGAVNVAIGDSRVGFGLFLFTFGEHGWMTWISNGERAEMIPALKEWIATNEAPAPKARG